jgi:16S rRNA (guanine527-N7)-methyltransferase
LIAIPEETWQRLLAPYVQARPSAELLERLERYLHLLVRWNARINLTSVRSELGIIQRHFGESLFAANHVPRGTSTLLDHGSGGGFPGIPIALARPEIDVTLAESTRKKAAFLMEAVRELGVTATIHSGRTEDMPPGLNFDCVAMRAVDRADAAVPAGADRVKSGGCLLILGKSRTLPGWRAEEVPIPLTAGFLILARRDVPRGT